MSRARQPLEITSSLVVPGHELHFEYSRASGPGGQHVQKTETRVTLRLNVRDSTAFPEDVRGLLLERLAPRLTRSGEILVHVGTQRERLQNLEEARNRLAAILRKAAKRDTPRKATSPTRAAERRRRTEKQRTSQRKQGRKWRDDD